MGAIEPQSGEPQSGEPQSGEPPSTDPEAPGEDDHTVVVDRSSPGLDEDDRTIVVVRRGSSKPSTPRSLTTRKRAITPPPVPAGFAPQGVEGTGPGAKERYRPRHIPAPPAPAPVVVEGPAATREASTTMPSVSRHTRFTAQAAVTVFALSCVASVAGLTLIALALFRN